VKVVVCYKSDPAGARDRFTSLLPIGTVALHAFLRREGVDSLLANFSSFSWKWIESFLRRERPEIIAISQFTHNRHETIRLAELVRKSLPGALVVLGGPHATHRWREQLLRYSSIDAIVVGEGEATLLDLVGDTGSKGKGIAGTAVLEDGTPVLNPPRPLITGLDILPFPSEYLDVAPGVDPRAQGEFITTSRGCFCSCRFCSSPDFWGSKIRFRSPRSMVDDIRSIRDRYGLIYFSFRDDTFTVDRRRVIEFCRLLLEEKVYILWSCQSRVNAVDDEMLLWMRRAGCESIQYGIESGSERMLRLLGKGIEVPQMEYAAAAARNAGIRVSVYLITGIPGEDENDLSDTLRLLDRLKPHDGQVSPLAYFPGTALFRDASSSGEIPADIFESSTEPGVYARNDAFSLRSRERLLRRLEHLSAQAEFSWLELAAQESRTGFCHAGRIAAGERAEAEGDLRKAEAAYTAITEKQPSNPWGWLLLAELRMSTERCREALEAYRRLIEAVPAHLPGYDAAADAALAAGDGPEADRLRRKGRELAAGNKKGEA
jgi:anaerobic magnesium-protoporphyrin IX monomethyl ester cyclase